MSGGNKAGEKGVLTQGEKGFNDRGKREKGEKAKREKPGLAWAAGFFRRDLRGNGVKGFMGEEAIFSPLFPASPFRFFPLTYPGPECRRP
jgi:hypothetical protein